MGFRKLLLRNLFFHWHANLAVLLGVVIGAAVLTGALLVGDSLRGSLRDLTLRRLGRIDHALVSDRLFRSVLAQELTQRPEVKELAEHVAPALLLTGTVLHRDQDGRVLRRAGRVQIVGVTEAFWPLFDDRRDDLGGAFLINQALADELHVAEGDEVDVRLARPRAVPADALLGRTVEDPAVVLETSRIAAVLPSAGAGRLSLSARQQEPLILYVQLQRLQARLTAEVPAAANALLIAARPGREPRVVAQALQAALREAVTLTDLGLTVHPDESKSRYLALESNRMLIEPAVVDATTRLAEEAGWSMQPTLTYLANLVTQDRTLIRNVAAAAADGATSPSPGGIAHFASEAMRYSPYCTITGLEPDQPAPWGPFLKVDGGNWDRPLQADEILVTEWLAQDLWPLGDWRQQLGQPAVTLRYFVEGEEWLLPQTATTFRLAGVIARREAAADSTLTPDFPGLRGQSIRDWTPPFPKEQWHPEWVRQRDEDYWGRYRATPKAFVSPATAQRLWQSRYGRYTSLRFAPPAGVSWEDFGRDLRRRLRIALPPEKLGLQITPVKAHGLAAAGSSTAESFGWLFLGFSVFLIAAAVMLVGLLFRLGMERRAKEIGLLIAAGFRHRLIQRLLIAEGLILALLGSGLGVVLAVGYTAVLLHAMKYWWGDALHTTFLELHIAARETMFGPLPFPSLVLGFFLSVSVAVLTVAVALRGLGRIAPRNLLAGQTTGSITSPDRQGGNRRWTSVAAGALLLAGLALAVLGGLAAAGIGLAADAAPPLFFGSGAALLLSGLLWLGAWLRAEPVARLPASGVPGLVRLGTGNTRRNPGRSRLTVGLLASATFLIVAVEAFRQGGASEQAAKDSGTGGFRFYAEAEVPLYQPPGSSKQRRPLLPDASETDLRQLDRRLESATIYGFRVRRGDDVSCLNLYQPQHPRILGVPDGLILLRGGFRFSALWKPEPPERERPWRILERDLHGEVPVVADDHTATWVLHRSLGEAWNITAESGRRVTLRLVGLLKGSIFQSELLISEANFRQHFPGVAGYGFFLVDVPPLHGATVKHSLESAFGERYGLTVGRTADRLAAFQGVENTYLSTFQVLGGLGLLIGTLGLAVVLLRNVWERQGELALLRALGYPRSALGWMVLAENGFLVLLGLLIGVAAALLAVVPHVMERGRSLPWLGMAGLLGLVLLFGLLAGGLAVTVTLRTPLLPALRRD